MGTLHLIITHHIHVAAAAYIDTPASLHQNRNKGKYIIREVHKTNQGIQRKNGNYTEKTKQKDSPIAYGYNKFIIS